ncbi:MAG: DUF4139 domain-containing protein [Lewinellaceae bacterium]|nr:DUF4139 domain-containing protein [Lewinellaceae bacterium]
MMKTLSTGRWPLETSPKTIAHLFFLMMLLPLFAFADQSLEDTPSKVKEVTVFRQGAEVHREGRVSIPAGRSVLKFSGLSPSLNPQSIQFKATGDFTILSVRHQVNYLTDNKPNQEIEELTGRKEKFTLDMKKGQALLQVFQEEENLLLANQHIGGQQNGVPIDALKATAEYFRSRLREIKMERLDINERIQVLQDTINRLQQQLQQLSASRQSRSVSEVLVSVDAPHAVRSDFTISYLVGQAGWSPLYDLRVAAVGKPVELDYKAQVFQQSGEDWERVALTLSTGKPMSNAQRPVMNTWWLQEYTAVVARQKQQMPMMGIEADAELDEVKVTAMELPAHRPQVQTNDQATSFEFQIQTPYDIPSDGQQYVVSIGEESLPASYEYYAAPKLNPHAFLTANVTDWEQYRLLSGPANLFFEGTYLGKSYLNPDVAADTLSFSLGVDEGIAITRKKDKQYKDKQFIGSKQTKTVGWEIELRNNKRQDITIVIEDQYPVSTSDQIEVELETHKGAKVDKDSGLLRWELDLRAGTTAAIGFRYAVKYPKRMNLVLE